MRNFLSPYGDHIDFKNAELKCKAFPPPDRDDTNFKNMSQADIWFSPPYGDKL